MARLRALGSAPRCDCCIGRATTRNLARRTATAPRHHHHHHGRRGTTSTVARALAEEAPGTESLKAKLYVLAAQSDRGQLLFRQPVYEMEGYFAGKETEARRLCGEIKDQGGNLLASDASAQNGSWELVYSTAQLFRCSPFFMAISESMDGYTWHAPWSDESTAVPSATLFFRLHELQVMSWGASTVGLVTQTIDCESKTLSSTFDTILFRLTVIPIVGWFKLLPTFGGRVASYATNLEAELEEGEDRVKMTFELQETEVESVEGIPRPPFFLAWLLNRKFPVNFVWKLLPWNSKPPTCTSYCTYCDKDLRICEDKQGELYVYTRLEEGSRMLK
ncbi:hypothetical protein HOP50_12g67560 [Chloropicon primus]|nr:hypothetical protein HOP50_12g67560 [Chloropicon primus]